MSAEGKTHDPYARCEQQGCTHELARGVLVEELCNFEGPYPDSLSAELLMVPRNIIGPIISPIRTSAA